MYGAVSMQRSANICVVFPVMNRLDSPDVQETKQSYQEVFNGTCGFLQQIKCHAYSFLPLNLIIPQPGMRYLSLFQKSSLLVCQ